MRIYAGNLPLDTTEVELRNLFAAFGEVVSLQILMNTASGKSRGYAFVEMPSVVEANAAIASLNGHELGGYFLNVKEAFAPKKHRLPVPSMPTRHQRRQE